MKQYFCLNVTKHNQPAVPMTETAVAIKGQKHIAHTANVLSAEIADECLQTKSKDNLQ